MRFILFLSTVDVGCNSCFSEIFLLKVIFDLRVGLLSGSIFSHFKGVFKVDIFDFLTSLDTTLDVKDS
jgi:hypothetical protein